MMNLRSSASMLARRHIRYTSQRNISKVFKSADEALQGLEDNMTVLFGGFGLCGIPENLIAGIQKKGVKNLTVVSNDCGTDDFGLGLLLANKQIGKMVASYIGENKAFPGHWKKGEVELELVPQGTLAEKLRSAGAGIPAFYTPTGYGTVVQEGNFPVKYTADGQVEKVSKPKDTKVFNGRTYVLEESIFGHYACIKAWKADTKGNLVFRGTSRNFNPECAKAAKVTIAEVEEIVEAGSLHPDDIHVPGVFVQRVIKGAKFEKRIMKHTLSTSVNHSHSHTTSTSTGTSSSHKPSSTPAEDKSARREVAAMRAALECHDGMYVNLGIGIPTLVSNYLFDGPNTKDVILQSENGLLDMGPYPHPGSEDPDLINAGKELITYLPGSSVFSSSESFGMIRGKHIDMTILGALEVSEQGDLASWVIPNKSVKGMGGAMDLVSACEKIVVTMNHTDSAGKSKILHKCKLPLTGKRVADMIITDLAVFHVDRKGLGGLTLTELAPGVTLEEVKAKTEATFKVSDTLKVMPI